MHSCIGESFVESSLLELWFGDKLCSIQNYKQVSLRNKDIKGMDIVPSKVETLESLHNSRAASIMEAELSTPCIEPFPCAKILANSAFSMPSVRSAQLFYVTRDRGTDHHIQCREEHHLSVDLAMKLPLWPVWVQKRLSVGTPKNRV